MLPSFNEHCNQPTAVLTVLVEPRATAMTEPDHDGESAPADADRFVVGIHRTDSELEFVVRVPSDIDSGWRNPTAFQQLVERLTWERLDQASTLRAIAAGTAPGETVRLGWIRLQPDGTVVDHSLSAPETDMA